MAEGKMGIVIVNYNGANYQNDALRSIYASSYTNFEVYNGYFKTKRRYAWGRLMEYLGTGCPDTQ